MCIRDSVLAMTQDSTPEETVSNWYKAVFVEGATA